MTKLKVVYQCCDLPGGKSQSAEQINRVLKSDLVNNADIFLSLNGNLTAFLDLVLLVEPYSNIRICHTSERRDLMEYPALNLLKELADSATEEEYIMYFHLKGVTHGNHQGIHDWRKYMEYWTIDKWRDNIAKLDDGYDTCGTNYIYKPFIGVDQRVRTWPHYSGGFWWARSSYIKRLDPLPHPDSYVTGTTSKLTGYEIDSRKYFRFDHEAWVASGNPNWAEIHKTLGTNHDNEAGSYPGWHYHHQYPEHMYKK